MRHGLVMVYYFLQPYHGDVHLSSQPRSESTYNGGRHRSHAVIEPSLAPPFYQNVCIHFRNFKWVF